MTCSIESICELSSRALTEPMVAMKWISPNQVEFSEDVQKQAEINRKRNRVREVRELYELPTTDDQIITDYWIKYFYIAGSTIGKEELLQAIDDIISLSHLFNSSYVLSMLEGYVGRLVYKSPEREEIGRKLRTARAESPEFLEKSWDSFILACEGA